MKTFITFSAIVITAFIFSAANAQQPAALPKPQPMVAPALKVKNQPQSSSSAKPAAAQSQPTAKPENKKAQTAPVDNKIAVSDAGAPVNKSTTRKDAAPAPNATKKTSGKGVSPK